MVAPALRQLHSQLAHSVAEPLAGSMAEVSELAERVGGALAGATESVTASVGGAAARVGGAVAASVGGAAASVGGAVAEVTERAAAAIAAAGGRRAQAAQVPVAVDATVTPLPRAPRLTVYCL